MGFYLHNLYGDEGIDKILRKGMSTINCEILTKENQEVKRNYELLSLGYSNR
jgi:protoheme ferro-lyase